MWVRLRGSYSISAHDKNFYPLGIYLVYKTDSNYKHKALRLFFSCKIVARQILAKEPYLLKKAVFMTFCAQNASFCSFLLILSMAIFTISVIIKMKKSFKIGCLSFLQDSSIHSTRKGSEKVYTAMNIASEIVRQYEEHGAHITNLKLQKVLYYAQMYSLQENGCALFDDDFQAWRHGPVIPGVYEIFRKYVSGEIKSDDIVIKNSHVTIDASAYNTISHIVEQSLPIDAWDMVFKTHETRPWKDTYIPNQNRVITKDQILHDGEVNLT